MSIRPHTAEPCWEIVRASTGQTPQGENGDGWPHYTTRAEAEADLAETQRDYDDPLKVAQSFDRPCVGLFCDGTDCDGEPIDVGGDEGWTHLDPDDPIPMDLDDLDVIERDGKHYCEACSSAWPWCDDCDERHEAGTCDASATPPSPLCVAPDGSVLDVPMFGETA
jgi:hypothetical protein